MSLSWFDEMVERGRPVEARQRQAVEAATQRAQAVLHELGKLCQDTVEYESKAMLKRFGLMTRDDVRLLAFRLETLSKKIDDLAART
jgi:polyhydroxyalkanoate synthesis regulator phasin